jgi:hypothetical protein
MYCNILLRNKDQTQNSQFSELVTSDIGAHRDDEQEIVTGRQSFMKLFFFTTLTALLIKFTQVLWNYIYLNWNKALFRYSKIFNFLIFPSEIGNIALIKLKIWYMYTITQINHNALILLPPPKLDAGKKI